MINDLKRFLHDEQDPKAVEKTLARMNSFLTSGETIAYVAVQKKPIINLSPNCIALTNKRIIFCKPRNFGLAMDFHGYYWKDIAHFHIKDGIMGATFTVRTVKNRSNMMSYLPKKQARKLYQFAKEREEEMSAFRRQRELEE